jgi:hypothetical protein
MFEAESVVWLVFVVEKLLKGSRHARATVLLSESVLSRLRFMPY